MAEAKESKELSLGEWVERLPEIHGARKELAALVKALENMIDAYAGDMGYDEWVEPTVLVEARAVFKKAKGTHG